MAKVRAYHSASQAISSGTGWSALALNSERFDDDGMHDPSTNNSRLTAATAGYYLVNANLEWALSGVSYRELALRENGATIWAAQHHAGAEQANVEPTIALMTLLHLDVNDYVEAVVRHEVGADQNVLASGSYSPELSAVRVTDKVCRVYHNAAQTIAEGAGYTALSFNSERFDPELWHDPVTNNSRITPDEPGYYLCGAHIAWDIHADWPSKFGHVSIRKNGDINLTSCGRVEFGFEGDVQNLSLSACCGVQINAGDYVEVWVRQAGLTSSRDVVSLASYSPEFWVAKLGAK